jgi:excisionase family DNA binding protein
VKGAQPPAAVDAANGQNDARATILTPDELADRWKCKKKTLWRLSNEGKVPSMRLGRFYRYPLPLVEAFEAGSWTPADAQSVGFGSAERVAA